MRLEVLTPQAVVFEGEVDAVVAPLPDGWIGVLPGHSPFLARLMRGQVLLRNGDGEQRGRDDRRLDSRARTIW